MSNQLPLRHVCYLFQFRNVWEHCTAQILLLHEDTCLLFRSRNYGSRVTKPYLLAHHVADPVLQLSQQRQFLVHVAFSVLELTASYKYLAVCWMNSSHAELLSQTQISTQKNGTAPAYLRCAEALQHLYVCTSHCTRSSQLSSHCSSLLITCQQ